MKAKLIFSALLKYLLGVILVGALIFLPAGSFGFLNGWLLLGVLFIPMLIVGVIMLFRAPDLLQSRLAAKEKQREQSAVVRLSALMFIVGFIVAGLDFRFDLFPIPLGVSIGGAVLFLAAYLLYAEVMRENAYLSRTIEVKKGQKVVDTGLYGIVRHPMYSATLILFLAMPMVLGSLCALPVFLAYPFIIAIRIKHEEKLLEAELDGYTEYKNKVRYRMIPFIW